MRWPFVSRRVHELQEDMLQARVRELYRDRDYWRERAELLIDGHLQRAGGASVMAPTPATTDAATRSPFCGMALSAIPTEGRSPIREDDVLGSV